MLYGCLLTLSAGTLYAVSVYTKDLMKTLNFTHGETTIIFAIADVGLFSGMSMGRIYDRFGSIKAGLVTTTFLFFGYFMCYLMLSHKISGGPVLFAVFMVFIGQGSTGNNTISIATNSKNFPPK